MSIGHILRLIRTHKGLNQIQMAEMLGISQNYLSLIESDKKTPSAGIISKMAKKLKVSRDALIFAASDVPDELPPEDQNVYRKLQHNVTALLIFELTGEFKESA